MLMPKPIVFLGSSRRALAAFPDDARRTAGFQLDRVQRGIEPVDWKPLTSVGKGVAEIRIHESSGEFRVAYLAKLDEAVLVLHAFPKKSRKMSRLDLELARTRYGDLMRNRE